MSAEQAKYRTVIEWVVESLRSGELKEGDRLPAEMELARKFNLSRQTIRHATGELEKQGIVVRVQGSGTYIADRDPAEAIVTAEAEPSLNTLASRVKDSSIFPESSPLQPVRKPVHRNIAVISTYVDGYIFPPTIRGIESVLSEAGFTMQISFTDDNISREGDILRQILRNDNVDGIIAEPSMSLFPNPNLDYYRMLRARGIPVIFFNDQYPDLDFPCVRIDDEEAAREMTDVLIRAGHSSIAGIFHSCDGQGARRYSGFVKAREAAGLPYEREHIMFVDSMTLKDISEVEQLIMDRISGCTAVFCYNDEIAYQLLPLLGRHGIRVPDDMSVTAIDCVVRPGGIPVKITSYEHPKDKLGIKIAENLLRILEDGSFNANYIFRGQPVIFNSVARIGETGRQAAAKKEAGSSNPNKKETGNKNPENKSPIPVGKI